MKKQETVNNNFQKNIIQWREKQRKKLDNIQLQKQNIVDKIGKLQKEFERLTFLQEKIQKQEPPKPLTEEERLLQKKVSEESSSEFPSGRIRTSKFF